jgi:long-chain acyl-CoA synthetase
MTKGPAVHCGGTVRSHAEVRERSQRLATGLRELGVAAGDRYAVLLRNEVAFLEATAAGAALGAVPVPVNWHWTGDDLRHLLVDSGSRVVVAHTDLLPAAEAVAPAGLRFVEVVPPADVSAAYGQDRPSPTGRHPELEDLLATHGPLARTDERPALGVIYTSGTTGSPKGILRDRVTPEQSAAIGAALLRTFAAEPSMSTLVPAPLYHTAPNAQAVFALALGMDLHLMPRFDAEGFLRLVEERRIEHVQMVPTMFVRLLQLPEAVRSRYDISSLRAIVHAAAPCPVEVKRAMIDWFGPIIHEYYGGSETGAVVICDSEEWLAHPGTVGHPVLGSALRILDQAGREVPAGETGEVYAKPFEAWPDFTYIGGDDKRRAMERDGYLSIGDVGHVDADGYLYLSDRRNDMIISGGVNIYPAEIEACLIGLDGVRDVAVFGVPDPDYGEAVAAHIELLPGADLDAGAVRGHVARHLARYKVPKVVVFEEALPREDSGKLFKRRLKAPYWQQAG